jgi:hypothetical protein
MGSIPSIDPSVDFKRRIFVDRCLWSLGTMRRMGLCPPFAPVNQLGHGNPTIFGIRSRGWHDSMLSCAFRYQQIDNWARKQVRNKARRTALSRVEDESKKATVRCPSAEPSSRRPSLRSKIRTRHRLERDSDSSRGATWLPEILAPSKSSGIQPAFGVRHRLGSRPNGPGSLRWCRDRSGRTSRMGRSASEYPHPASVDVFKGRYPFDCQVEGLPPHRAEDRIEDVAVVFLLVMDRNLTDFPGERHRERQPPPGRCLDEA